MLEERKELSQAAIHHREPRIALDEDIIATLGLKFHVNQRALKESIRARNLNHANALYYLLHQHKEATGDLADPFPDVEDGHEYVSGDGDDSESDEDPFSTRPAKPKKSLGDGSPGTSTATNSRSLKPGKSRDALPRHLSSKDGEYVPRERRLSVVITDDGQVVVKPFGSEAEKDGGGKEKDGGGKDKASTLPKINQPRSRLADAAPFRGGRRASVSALDMASEKAGKRATRSSTVDSSDVPRHSPPTGRRGSLAVIAEVSPSSRRGSLAPSSDGSSPGGISPRRLSPLATGSAGVSPRRGSVLSPAAPPSGRRGSVMHATPSPRSDRTRSTSGGDDDAAAATGNVPSYLVPTAASQGKHRTSRSRG